MGRMRLPTCGSGWRARFLPLAGAALLAGCGSGAAGPAPQDASPGVPRVLYVEPRGDQEGTGTSGSPYGSLDHALEQLRAGDTLLVAGGTYEEQVEVEAASGSEQAPVRVEVAEGERAVLRGLLWLDDPDWWRIVGLDVTWADRNRADQHMVKITDGDHWVVQDAEIWGARSYAAVLVAGDPERFALRRLHVHDTRKANGTNEDHLIYLNSGRGGGVVEGCLLVGSPNGRAVKVGPPDEDGSAVSDVVLRYNTMVDNRGPSNVQLAWRSRDVEIYRNIMVGAAPGRANVTAYDLDGRGNVVRDNIGTESTAVLEQDVDGLVDGGGNLRLDPRLRDVAGRPAVPTAPDAAGYGHTALPG